MYAINGNRELPRKLKISTQKHPLSGLSSHRCIETASISSAASTTSYMSSISWVAEKSASEIGSLLKNAYKSLKQKERDLVLAAEIGKSLLEQNQTLQSNYTQLLNSTESYHRGEIAETSTKPTGSQEDEQEEQQQMRIMSNLKSYNTVIESLERKNAEIQQLLDQAHEKSDSTGQSYERKIRKFEHEIFTLQNSLDIAGQRIQELEESQKTLCERTRCLDGKKIQQQRTDDLLLMEELAFKLDQLVHENNQLKSSKNAVTENLAIALNELDTLRQGLKHFELTRESYANLQIEFSRQANHVDELNKSLEDHRVILSRLRDRGVWSSSQHSHTFSDSGLNDSNISTCFSNKNHLLGELEIAWRKNSLNQVTTTTTSLSSLVKIHDATTERNITSFYNAPADCALSSSLLSTLGIQNHDCLDDSLLTAEYHNNDYKYEYDFDFDDDGEYADNKEFFDYDDHLVYPKTNIYPSYSAFDHRQIYVKAMNEQVPPEGFFSRILFHARSFVSTALGWFRFTIILTTAILINLWRGPTTILTK